MCEWSATSKGRAALDAVPNGKTSSAQQQSGNETTTALRVVLALVQHAPLASRLRAGIDARRERLARRRVALTTLLSLIDGAGSLVVRQQLLRALLHYDALGNDAPSTADVHLALRSTLLRLLDEPTCDAASRLLAVRALATCSSPNTLAPPLFEKLAALAWPDASANNNNNDDDDDDDDDGANHDRRVLQRAAWLALRVLTARVVALPTAQAGALDARRRLASLLACQLHRVVSTRSLEPPTTVAASQAVPTTTADQRSMYDERRAVQLLGALRIVASSAASLLAAPELVADLLQLASPPLVSPRVARAALRLTRTLLPLCAVDQFADAFDTLLLRIGTLLTPHGDAPPPPTTPHSQQITPTTSATSLTSTATATTKTTSAATNNKSVATNTPPQEWLVLLTDWRLDSMRLGELLLAALGADAFSLTALGGLTRGLMSRLASQTFAKASVTALHAANSNGNDDDDDDDDDDIVDDDGDDDNNNTDEKVVDSAKVAARERRRRCAMARRLGGVPLSLPLERSAAERLARGIATAGGAVTMVEARLMPPATDTPAVRRAFALKPGDAPLDVDNSSSSSSSSSPPPTSCSRDVTSNTLLSRADTYRWLSGAAAHALASELVALARHLLTTTVTAVYHLKQRLLSLIVATNVRTMVGLKLRKLRCCEQPNLLLITLQNR
jgi:hypothetical protein